jgi:hypothetical protein
MIASTTLLPLCPGFAVATLTLLVTLTRLAPADPVAAATLERTGLPRSHLLSVMNEKSAVFRNTALEEKPNQRVNLRKGESQARSSGPLRKEGKTLSGRGAVRRCHAAAKTRQGWRSYSAAR